jgi:hypothetical protein
VDGRVAEWAAIPGDLGLEQFQRGATDVFWYWMVGHRSLSLLPTSPGGNIARGRGLKEGSGGQEAWRMVSLTRQAILMIV